MRKIISKSVIIISVCSLIAPLFSALPALAQLNLGIEYGENIGLSSKDPRDIAVDIIQVILGYMAIIMVIMILYAGFLWMVSGNNEDNMAKAKSMLASAIIGLLVILSAWSIASFAVGVIFNATTS